MLNCKAKELRTRRNLRKKYILLSVFLFYTLSFYTSTYVYASLYKFIYKCKVLNKQGIKINKEKSILNRKNNYADLIGRPIPLFFRKTINLVYFQHSL